MNMGLLYWIRFFLVYVVIWIGLDFVFNGLRKNDWVFVEALKKAIYRALLTFIAFYLVDYVIQIFRK